MVDASAVAVALVDDTADGDQARRRLRAERLVAPEVVDLEVVSAIRRLLLAGRLDDRRAAFALDDFVAMDLRRMPHWRLLPRVWELRHNLTPYDAAYVALAEILDTLLLTSDQRLARAPGVRCAVEHLA